MIDIRNAVFSNTVFEEEINKFSCIEIDDVT